MPQPERNRSRLVPLFPHRLSVFRYSAPEDLHLTIYLVHGAFHGQWCWSKISSAL